MLNIAKTKLAQENYTCVLTDGERFFTSRERGVKPIVEFIASKSLPKGLFAADKVVGRATAFLYCLLGVRQIYAQVLSKGAQQVLEEYGIPYFYDCLVPGIRNRNDTGPCPMEAATRHTDDPQAALAAIRQTLKKLQG